MVALVMGTTAELLKISPLVRDLQAGGEAPVVWWSGMHGRFPAATARELGLATVPVRTLHSGQRTAALTTAASTVPWVHEVLRRAVAERRQLRTDLATGSSGRALLVVHGDTLTTALGAAMGKALRSTVAHVEAGLRSHSLRHPFPEEANRRITTRLTDIHFAPGPQAVDNLRGCRGIVVDTLANTAIDALRHSMAGRTVEPSGYGIATLHRFELLHNRTRLRETIGWLHEAAERTPIRFFAGATDLQALTTAGLVEHFDDQLVLCRRESHQDFIRTLVGAEFVVTDSGGLQEECAYLGIPTLVHRARTERHDGLGTNVVLSRFDEDTWQSFFAGLGVLRVAPMVDDVHPTSHIVEFLKASGYLSCNSDD